MIIIFSSYSWGPGVLDLQRKMSISANLHPLVFLRLLIIIMIVRTTLLAERVEKEQSTTHRLASTGLTPISTNAQENLHKAHIGVNFNIHSNSMQHILMLAIDSSISLKMSTMKRKTDQNLVEFGAVSDVVVQHRRRGGWQAGQEGQGQEQEGEGVGP